MPTRLIIIMDEDQNIQLEGPVSNRPLCYAMLEMAKDAIRQHNEGDHSLIQPASNLPPLPPGRM